MSENDYIKYSSQFSILFLCMGIFALIGAMFTWGEGWLFAQEKLELFLIPFADLVMTGPICLAVAWGIWKQQTWGILLGLVLCGILLLGSLLVYIEVFWVGRPWPVELLLPPLFGIGLALLFINETIKWSKISR